MADTSIKWFVFTNKDAPVLDNSWGCMIPLLDACLVNGFGAQTSQSYEVKDGVGKITFLETHSIQQFQVIDVSGAAEPTLNGEFKVLGVTGSTIEFLVTASDAMISTPVTVKLASLGWAKEFEGSGKAVYRAKDLVSNPYYLRVDGSQSAVALSTGLKFSKVGILETCSGIDDISSVNQGPFDAQKNWVPSGTGSTSYDGWAKWYNATDATSASSSIQPGSAASAGNRSWILIGNKDTFYIIPSYTSLSATEANTFYGIPYGFGVTEKFNIPFLASHLNYHQRGAGGMSGGMNCPLAFNNSGYSTERSFILMKNRLGMPNQTYNNLDFGFGDASPGRTNRFLETDDSMNYTQIYTIDNQGFFAGIIPLVFAPQKSNIAFSAHYQIYSEYSNKFLLKKTIGLNSNYGSLLFKIM